MKEFPFRYFFPYRTERSLVIQGRHLYSPRTKYNIMYSIIDLKAHDLYYTRAYIRNIIVGLQDLNPTFYKTENSTGIVV